MTVTVIHGDARTALAALPAGSAQCCVTSPPYYRLRDYKAAGQIGLEATPDAYVAELVAVFREVRRVLAEDGTLWLNLGDSYHGGGMGGGAGRGGRLRGSSNRARQGDKRKTIEWADAKPKDLLGIPWMVAFALRADGWWLRSDIIWHKPKPMPESVGDRPTSAHEHVFLLAKSPRYFFDADAIREPHSRDWWNEAPSRPGNPDRKDGGGRQGAKKTAGRNVRNVWTIATQPYRGAHFATMPRDLAERCILAGSRAGDTVLDPFGGVGTTGLVADRLGRHAVLVEINPDHVAAARQRVAGDAPLLAEVS